MSNVRKPLAGFVLVMTIPLVAFFYIFIGIRGGNEKRMIILLSILSGFLVYYVPPFQDLSRRFYQTYNEYNIYTSYREVLLSHVDILYYIITLFFKKNGIPFFLVSVLAVVSSVYCHLRAIENILKHKKQEKNKGYYYFFYYSFINILIIALGIRMGWGVSLAIYSVSIFFFEDKKKVKFIVYMLLSITMHFSMIFIFIILLLSCFLKINKKFILIFIILSFAFGKVIVPWLFNSFSFGNLSSYALNGYINNESFVVQTNNTNEMIVNIYHYIFIAFMLIVSFKNEDVNFKSYYNFVYVYLCCAFLFSSFYIVFNRYIFESGIYFYILCLTATNSRGFERLKNILLFLAIFNLCFSTVYLQRRPIMLGEMWKSLITPPVLLLNYTENDFENLLKYIGSDGNWIGHELGK